MDARFIEKLCDLCKLQFMNIFRKRILRRFILYIISDCHLVQSFALSAVKTGRTTDDAVIDLSMSRVPPESLDEFSLSRSNLVQTNFNNAALNSVTNVQIKDSRKIVPFFFILLFAYQIPSRLQPNDVFANFKSGENEKGGTVNVKGGKFRLREEPGGRGIERGRETGTTSRRRRQSIYTMATFDGRADIDDDDDDAQ